ncbi:hypothetical protein [Agrobacterium rubi]|uniref:Uncharacterized protein n=1 Tax=Agrobacterium rubi TaxID=28099 RepID=A0AAE7REB0_9HYPH|nr:hypothetical protein [Agrobacterium rubi]NTE89635.1 hypothetical protein [Agrobacterium rubi]NTF05515.1 hypothetical protein [Agrobacterium rubi]NTF39958.1 hypothetical protein [Agrobacterium rubi]OCJ44749.1 hypothetical protein A6U92_15980 [Agrobacterium rubi]QTG03846.1 hypothetical protein G6M88_25730 [Agrobacterium rubi]
MDDQTIAQNIEIYDTDSHLAVSNIHRKSAHAALSAVEFWITNIKSKMVGSEFPKSLPTSFRFFYTDYLYRDLMFRWKFHAAYDQPPQLVLARVEVHARFRGKGHFKKLLSGLQGVAQQHGATLLVEQANPNLSRILMSQGYIRCIGASADTAQICFGLRGTWKHDPVGGQSMGLIALPGNLLKQIDESRVPSDLQVKIDHLVQQEITQFQTGLRKRLETEILPEVMAVRHRDRELANAP